MTQYNNVNRNQFYNRIFIRLALKTLLGAKKTQYVNILIGGKMKLYNIFLSAIALLAMGAVSGVFAQAETIQSADQVDEILDHLGLYVEDLEFFEEEPFTTFGKKGGNDKSKGDRAGRGGKNKRDKAGRGGRGKNKDRAGRGGRRHKDNDKHARKGGRKRGGHSDYRRGHRNNDDDDDGRHWRRTPRHPRYPVPPVPQVRCYAYGNQTRSLYPVIGRTAHVAQQGAMNYCYRYNRTCEARGCSY